METYEQVVGTRGLEAILSENFAKSSVRRQCTSQSSTKKNFYIFIINLDIVIAQNYCKFITNIIGRPIN